MNFLYFGLQVTLFYCIYVFISITAFTNFVVELCVFKGTNVPLKLYLYTAAPVTFIGKLLLFSTNAVYVPLSEILNS